MGVNGNFDGEELWKRVSIRLVEKNMTLKGMTEIAGLNYGSIKVQKSKGSLTKIEDAISIANALDLSLDYLLTGKEAEPFCDEALLVDHDEKLRLIVRQLKADPTFLEAISITLASKERTDAANVVNLN